jgi:drug/metabolite transporter (DMT)-like permease
MHASWNLMARDQRSAGVLLRMLLLSTMVGIGPALAGEWLAPAILPLVGGHLVIAGFFQGLYFFGLTLGYRLGQFTVVYPLARALPVLLIALSDVAAGRAPSPLGWIGIIMIFAGCVIVPLTSVRTARLAQYLNHGTFWAVVTACGILGYSLTDAAAADMMPTGPSSALRYGLFETILTLPFYWAMLRIGRVKNDSQTATPWSKVMLISALVFGAYSLVLWAYQLSIYTSYVVALRQFSIVIGVGLGSLLFREPAPALRLAAALTITAGSIAIAMAR